MIDQYSIRGRMVPSKNNDGTFDFEGIIERLPTDQQPLVSHEKAKEEIGELNKALRANLDAWGSGALYNGSYTNLILRNALAATGDVDYWNQWKIYFELVKSKATQTYRVIASGQFNHPENEGNLFTGPAKDFGADFETYVNFEDYTTGGSPNAKGQQQWAMTALHLLYEVITRKVDLASSEREYAVQAFHWIHRNIVEFLAVERGDGWTGSRWYRNLLHARDKDRRTPPGQTGYWGSNVGVGIVTFVLSDAIRRHLELPKSGYMNWVDQVGQGSDAAVWSTIRWEPAEWYGWWKSAVHIFPEGYALWDCGDSPADPAYNPYINTTGGWAYTGEHKCPGTAHASRYMYLAQVALDTGIEQDTSLIRALSQTFGERMCLPLDYVTQQGEHAGKIAGTQQISNYIDGDNSCFRCPEPGFFTANGSNEGMEGYVYQGWYLGAIYNESALQAMTRLFNDVTGQPALNAADLRHTGTYQRHNSSFGRAGLWAAMLDIGDRRNKQASAAVLVPG